MKSNDQLWSIFISWLKRKIQSPFSNLVTKTLLLIGAGVIATPLLEHILFSAILKHWLGIDLGIEIPDTKAYITGCIIISLAAAHNLIFIKLNNERDIQIKDASRSTYRELWNNCDKAIDDVVRLNHLYTTKQSEQDEKLTTAAENSVMMFMEFLRLNRPFLFSEDFYQKGSSITKSCWWQIRCFRACMQKKAEFEEKGRSDYDFYLAEKTTTKEMNELTQKYDELCEEIRAYIEAI